MYEYKFTLKRVIDGDTVVGDIDLGFNTVLTDRHIRLRGLDAPECRTVDIEEKAFGLFVKRYVRERLEEAESIIIKTYIDPKEKFGRILGELIINGVNLNEELINKNYAVLYGSDKNEVKNLHYKNWLELKEKLNND